MIREALMSAMMNANNKNLDSQSSADSEKTTPDVNKIKSDWNKFLSWMQSKGVQGKSDLDKGELGNKYFKEYIKANPQTSLNESVIPIIRQEYTKLRDEKIADILAGKAGFNIEGIGQVTGEKARPYLDRFMSHILSNEKSTNPNYVGQHLTQTLFPGAVSNEYENGKLVKTTKTELGSLEDISEAYRKKNQEATPKSTKVVISTTKKQ